jgi:hypothetical protein
MTLVDERGSQADTPTNCRVAYNVASGAVVDLIMQAVREA